MVSELDPRGQEEARNHERGVHAVFVGVHLRRGTLILVAGLPLVVAIYIEVERLAPSKGVALGQAHHDAGPHSVGGLPRHVGLHIEVVGLVEETVDLQVERVAGLAGVPWGEVEVDHAEQSV